MKKIKINDITMNDESAISTKILSHKDFAPLDEEIVEVNEKDRKKKILTIIGAVIGLAIVFFYIGHAVSIATVSIEKTRVPFAFSNDVIVANQSETSELPFTVVEVVDTHHESVVPDLINSSPKKATGSVIVYNANSKSKMTLKKGTVFIANNNIRFLSDTTVTLPGYTIDGSKQIVPGQVIVKITAEKNGAASNIGNADLTLASYQKQKAKIYARTTEIISGGSDQMAYGLSEQLKKSVSEKIDDSLKKSLFIKTGAEIPDDYILYLDMFTYNPKNLVIAGTQQTLDVSKEASLIAYVFKREDIEKIIKNKITAELPVSPQYLGISDLKVTMITTPTNILEPQTLQLSFTGKGEVVSYIDTTDLAKQLTSLKLKNAKQLLSSIKSLQSFEISIKPKLLWVMPKSSKRIKIIDVQKN